MRLSHSIAGERKTHGRPVMMVALLVIAFVTPARQVLAGQHPTQSDTGWIHTGKRECCNDAIARAQDASAASCESVGGSPAPLRGGVQRRGSCAWESAVDDDGVTVFRCRAEASVWCR